MERKLLETLHHVLGQELLDRIKAGDSNPALLNVARQFLRDNGIESLPVADSPLTELIKHLPDFGQEFEECPSH